MYIAADTHFDVLTKDTLGVFLPVKSLYGKKLGNIVTFGVPHFGLSVPALGSTDDSCLGNPFPSLFSSLIMG